MTGPRRARWRPPWVRTACGGRARTERGRPNTSSTRPARGTGGSGRRARSRLVFRARRNGAGVRKRCKPAGPLVPRGTYFTRNRLASSRPLLLGVRNNEIPFQDRAEPTLHLVCVPLQYVCRLGNAPRIFENLDVAPPGPFMGKRRGQQSTRGHAEQAERRMTGPQIPPVRSCRTDPRDPTRKATSRETCERSAVAGRYVVESPNGARGARPLTRSHNTGGTVERPNALTRETRESDAKRSPLAAWADVLQGKPQRGGMWPRCFP